ncbi:MAG: 3'(2'),5'-bisphosphate nucleotidase CysQ [Pseudomonadota bacterium]|nr:3'(2'),5'-bisphosphate nucleotidase CysQ [Pseudomonadota bacterium]
MPENDLELLIRASRAAAETSLGFVGGPLDVREKDDGQGPVTAADLAVNEVLEDILRSARPDYGWLSEESAEDPNRLTSEYCFIVDPIDGTRSFINGEKTWSHSMAVAKNGEVVAGAVIVPMRDQLYTASQGTGAHLNGQVISVANATSLQGANILATKQNMEPDHWPQGIPTFKRHHRPSIAYRLCLVAEGRFDAMFTFRKSWEWDIAAGAIICAEAGAKVSDQSGQTLRFNSAGAHTDGIVAAPDQIWGEVTQRR